MKFLIHWLLVVFTFLNPSITWPALTDYDRQEFGFFNALKDKNAGFESGKANWTASGGSFTIGTSPIIEGKQFGIFDASSAGQTLTSAAVTLHRTGTCEVSGFFRVPSGTSTYLLQAYDGTNILGSETITNSTTAIEHITEYPCQASGTVAARVISVASNEPAIEHDGFKIGVARGVGAGTITTEVGATAWTPTGSWSTNTTYTGKWRQDGDFAEYFIVVTTSGAPTSANLTINLPSGHVIDTAKFTNGGAGYDEKLPASSGRILDNGSTYYDADAYFSSTSAVLIKASNSAGTYLANTGTVTQAVPMTWASGDSLSISFKVPIVGWRASTILNQDQQRLPKITRYTSGSGTHTTTLGTTYMRIRMVGGGGGGGSSGTASWGAATAGGNTTFGSSLLTANGGSAGGQSGLANGGSVTVNSPATQLAAIPGQGGQGATYSNPSSGNVATMGGNGGATFFGGAGSGSSYGTAGSAAGSNTGGGGGGAGGSSTTIGFYSGSGGGAGGFIEAQIDAPAASYAYAVGANGSGGTAGTSGLAGGNGGSGFIEVTEYFGYTTAILANSVSTATTNGDKIGAAEIDCDSSSSIVRNRQSMVSSVGNISSGFCVVTLATGYFSGIPDCGFTWDGSGNNQIVFTTCTTATACSVGSITDAGAANTTTQGQLICLGPR